METRAKLKILADAAKYDASCASSGSYRKRTEKGLGNTEGMGICHSYTPDGRCVSLLKILLTNYCIYDCTYCVNRISSDTPRARFTPEEVVFLTLEFYRRNYIEGLFLSSGVIQDVDYTMDQLIQVARALREDHEYGGYIHLKAVPGASEEALNLAGRYADRLSANIELPREKDLIQLAPAKSHTEIEQSMQQILYRLRESKDKTRRDGTKPHFAPAGQTTQMIVGATPATDADMLAKASSLYDKHKLRRVYYSAFSPIPHSDPNLPPASPPLIREHRLYQADWLMRFYGFDQKELTTPDEPNLSLKQDPKLGWALRHREFFPIDVNAGSKAALLRVPGLGVRNVERIIRIRRHHRIALEDLRRLHVPLTKAAPFLVTAGANPATRTLDFATLPKLVAPPAQLALFETAQTSRTGEI
jgi:putative DNA modification/repair radical SAM protein